MNTNTCSCLGMADGGRWGPIKVLGWVRGQGPHRDDIMRRGEERHVQAVRWWMLNNGTQRGIQDCFCAAGRSRSAVWIGAVWRLWEKQREFLHRGLERPPLQSALCATFPNISTERNRERESASKNRILLDNLPIFGWFRIFIILTSLKSWKRRQKKLN